MNDIICYMNINSSNIWIYSFEFTNSRVKLIYYCSPLLYLYIRLVITRVCADLSLVRRPNFNPLTVLPREASLLLDSKRSFVTSGRRGAIFQPTATDDPTPQILRPINMSDSSTPRDANGETGSGGGIGASAETIELDEDGTGSGSGSGAGPSPLTGEGAAANRESTGSSSRSSFAVGIGHMMARLMRRTWGSSAHHTSASDEGPCEPGGGEPGISQMHTSDSMNSSNARIPRTVSLDPTLAMIAASRHSSELPGIGAGAGLNPPGIEAGAAGAGSGGGPARNVMVQAARFELQRIFGLARHMQLLLLECESVNFAQQLVKCPLEPLVVYLRVPSAKVLTRLIKFSSSGELHTEFKVRRYGQIFKDFYF